MIRTIRSARTRLTTALAAAVVACAGIAPVAQAQRVLEKDEIRQLNGVDLLEHQGAKLPMDAVFTTADGKDVALAQYFLDGKPAILVLAYYECPIVCPTVLRSLAGTMNELDYDTGKDYRVLVVSFNHTETTTQALTKRADFFRMYDRAEGAPGIREGIEFFTGDETSVARLAESVGFAFNEIQGGEFAHPVSLMAISPDGVLTRYVYGYDYPARDLKLTLIDATEGRIAKSLGDKLLGFCYRYDPLTGSYSMVAFRVMQIGAGVTVVALAVFISLMFLGERVRRQRRAASGESTHESSVHPKGAVVGAPSGHSS